MIERKIKKEILQLLEEFPAVGLLGPRQVGKTTLSEILAEELKPTPVYLDLETPSNLARIEEPESYFDLQTGKLIILDEIQRVPELFAILRGVIDRKRKKGHRTGQFLILGSASLELLKQSSETLAGRIAYKELTGLMIDEVGNEKTGELWLRGGFPDSFMANSDEASLRWRQNFISTYLERDVPQFGGRVPANSLRLLWTMLAHNQGTQLNVAQLGANLGVTAPTAKRYIELLEDLLLVRVIRPWAGNIAKRLVKSPKIYIRDSGLTHALLNIATLDDLMGHPIVGASWEGFVIENLISNLPIGATYWFYRTAAGAEIDLVIEKGSKNRIAIEIKRSIAPKVSKGFYIGCEDIEATHKYVVYPGDERFSLGDNVTAISLPEIMNVISQKNEINKTAR
ncbi:MAG: ATP-binding protein [Pseudobacter sp.]|uniref:ATP-binding protein n=1 Tax=Pseudobacter sp. TaxID=2045420 RepID=UPI003F812B2A